MDLHRTLEGGSRRTRTGRHIRLGALGLTAVVALLMALTTATAMPLGVRPNLVLSAPYHATVTSPTTSVVNSGCSAAAASPAKWLAGTGLIHAAVTTSAKACMPIGGLAARGAGGGTATSTTQMQVAIPFTVSTNGTHSVVSSWTVTLSTVQTSTVGGCPTSRVHAHQPFAQFATSLCQDLAGFTFGVSATLFDESNLTWTGYTTSSAASYNSSGWENYTYCENYGTPLCANFTGPTGSVYSTGTNDPGFSAFTFAGTSSFSLWNNGTAMVANHHYLLIVTLGLSANCYAFNSNVRSVWNATASASINMSTGGNGALLNSITVV